MTYDETLEFLFNSLPAYHRVGAAAYKANLDNTHAMMDHLGHPERGFRSIHVAGTNGKGSVSHMLASILHRRGLRLGLYTSPHLVDFRERIRIDGKMIDRQSVVDFVEKNRVFFESHSLSFFEMTVGLAFDYFSQQRVDIAVVEVGMGGRLDSTNVITPMLSVITNIGLEHTQFLGDTMEKIAGEKAGIIKAGVPVVIGETQEETAPVFRAKAAECGSRIVFADKLYEVVEKAEADNTSVLHADVYRCGELWCKDLVSPLGGIYQRKNIATVLAAMEQLSAGVPDWSAGVPDWSADVPACDDRKAVPVPACDATIRDGIAGVIADTGLHGRWETVGENPLIICETAHNPAGVETLVAKLKTMHYNRLHIVYGCVNDKDYGHILDMMPSDACYYWTRPSVQRGLDEHELAAVAARHGKSGPVFAEVHTALAAAKKAAGVDDLIVITGSIFLVADYFAEP